jgi:hypothetical protein
MSNDNSAMEKVLALEQLIKSQRAKKGSFHGLSRLNRLMSSIKRVGLFEKLRLNGSNGKYLVIEGRSWNDTCESMRISAAPSFIMWEESEFLNFLENCIVQPGNKGQGNAVLPEKPIDASKDIETDARKRRHS